MCVRQNKGNLYDMKKSINLYDMKKSINLYDMKKPINLYDMKKSINLYDMKKSIAALIHRCSENNDDDDRHKYCPATGDSWCKYQAVNINTTTYKNSINIPKAISNISMPIFSWKDLGYDSLLERCLDGETQNVNESFNNVIWTKCQKNVYVGRKILEIGVASAVLRFNDGGGGGGAKVSLKFIRS